MSEKNEESPNLKSVGATALRLLTFRSTREELRDLGTRHLVFGLVCTWLAGVGRYWDNERANFLQHLGVGSVVYVFALSLLLWLIVWPLKPKNWSYIHVCTFVSLVSPPAILYAIPVERVFSLQTAVDINVWFLAVVAAWRVALLFFYLARHAQLGWLKVIVASLLPLMLIVIALTLLNLERAVFHIMGGIAERTANDGAYAVLLLLMIISFTLFIPTLLCYIILAATSGSRSEYSIVAAETKDDRN